MFPSSDIQTVPSASILRACGDVSPPTARSLPVLRYSPRMRRCFLDSIITLKKSGVFSAHAEMFPAYLLASQRVPGILRACGDVSPNTVLFADSVVYSPRMRRCFYMKIKYIEHQSVFSAHAEMFLPRTLERPEAPGILRACGDVSKYFHLSSFSGMYSPRMRRCF